MTREQTAAGLPKPLDGIRVLEFGVAIAGPTCARFLAALGAEVVKVEDLKVPDIMRLYRSSWIPAGVPPLVSLDLLAFGAEYLSGKLSIGLDIKAPKGRKVFDTLLRHSDVVVINYAAPAIRNLRLRYEDIVEVNHRVVYCSLTGFGDDDTSPYYTYKAWGPNLAPAAGIDHLTGWPDRSPSGIGSFAYPDFTGGMHAAVAVLVGILQRDITGEGTAIDLSQFEVAVAGIGPVIMDFTANRVNCAAQGNRLAAVAPHGIYPARGQERWVAIACRDHDEWVALCNVAGDAAFVDDIRFRTLAGRIANAEALDDAVGKWTSSFTCRDLAYRLQGAGCPAGIVADQADLLVDPQLEDRQAFSVGDHARLGKDLTIQFPVQMSEANPRLVRGTPTVGQDNTYVLEEVLGLSHDEREKLVADGVVFDTSDPEVALRAPYLPWIRHFWRADWPNPDH
jgi:crotonobetainyl-CoA:carnitine CoA-transferase CaiB-like acyl-CoA transferase